MSVSLQDFKNQYSATRAFIIGKGPSLDTISDIESDLNTGAVFCLNESIHAIEKLNLNSPIYVVQQDSDLEYDCVPRNPSTVHFMNSFQHTTHKYQKKIVDVSPWNPRAVLYNPREIGETICSLSAIVALKIAALMGVNSVTLCCFDALENDFNGSAKYADCIGMQKEGSHRSHNKIIVKSAHDLMQSVKTLKPHVASVEK